MRARLGAEVLGFLEGVDEAAAALRMPFLILHGEADRICPVGGSQRFYELLGSW
jgi:acylglycerol lipase